MATTKRTKQTTGDRTIRSLEPGESIELFRDNIGTRTIAERSESGNRLRIIRVTTDGERILGYELDRAEPW